ncbi:MAG: DegV family protein [Bacilli bacterium]|nr:DegV family protein [Bacilli bacterium]
MRIAISGESPMDFDKAMQEKYGVYSVPFHIQLGDVSYLDDGTHDNQELFDYFDRTKKIPRTSAANINEIQEHFENILKENDAVIHFAISSGLSSGYQNAVAARNDDPRIFVIDSNSFSLGIGYMALYAKTLVDTGEYTPEQIVEKCEELKGHVCASLVVRDLVYMAKGGRCSSLTGLLGSMLHIIPVLVVKNGKLVSEKKLQGNIRKLGKKYVEYMLSQYEGIDYSVAMVGYSTELHSGVLQAAEALKAAGFEKVEITKCNATCPAHGGPEVIGFSFRYEKEKE